MYCVKISNGTMTSDQVHESPGEEHVGTDQMETTVEKRRIRGNTKKKENTSKGRGREKMTKDERDRKMEEKKLKKLVSLY